MSASAQAVSPQSFCRCPRGADYPDYTLTLRSRFRGSGREGAQPLNSEECRRDPSNNALTQAGAAVKCLASATEKKERFALPRFTPLTRSSDSPLMSRF